MGYFQYLDLIVANGQAINYTISLGFFIWYGLMPSFLHCCTYLNSNLLLSPEILKYVKEYTGGLYFTFINALSLNADGIYLDLLKLDNTLYHKMVESDASTSGVGSESSESNKESLPFVPEGRRVFDPPGIRERELNKVVLSKLVFSCLTLSLLTNIAYVSCACVYGGELRYFPH